MKQACDTAAATSLPNEPRDKTAFADPVHCLDNAALFTKRSKARSVLKLEWHQAVSCEARNALQVILSGSEILLDSQFGKLTPDQQRILSKVIGSVQHLDRLIATLT